MGGVDPAVARAVDALYRASDVGASAHEAYVDLYLPDATLIMGPTVYRGHEGVREFRRTGWENVSRRKHVCKGVYPSSSNPTTEVMVYGTVDYAFKDGSVKEGVEWAGRLVFSPVGEDMKIAFYQVYLVGAVPRVIVSVTDS